MALSFMVQEPGRSSVVEGQIAVLQALEVAQHLVLGVVGVEHRVSEDGVVAQEFVGRAGSAGDLDGKGLRNPG